MRKVIFFIVFVFSVLIVKAHSLDFTYHAPQKTDAQPVTLELYNQNFSSASFTWFYYGDLYFAIGLFNEAKDLVAGVVVTPDECDNITELDGVTFPNNEQNVYKYYFSTFWLLNSGDLQTGAGWSKSVIKLGEGSDSYYALNAGTYHIQIYECDGYSMTSAASTLEFTLTSFDITDLQANVSDDNTSVTLTWKQPALPKSSRVYVSVQSEGVKYFDNYDGNIPGVSPLVVQVEPNKTYTAFVQVLADNNSALGMPAQITFTVGKNKYLPYSLNTSVKNGDIVTFSWEADILADKYVITLYKDGLEYGTVTVDAKKEKEVIIEPGEYTWSLTAYKLGDDNNYYPVSETVSGGKFVTTSETEGQTKKLDVTYLEAVYAAYTKDNGFDVNNSDPSIREGKYYWIIRLETGETGFPRPWITIYSDYRTAISGTYSTTLDNVDMLNCFMDMNGVQDNIIEATDVQLKLNFEGYNEDYLSDNKKYGDYSGSFKMTCTNGITYYGNFSRMWCNSYNYEYWTGQATSEKDIEVYMYEEENKPSAVEQVAESTELDLTQPMFNVLGQKVNATYKGIIIQKGKKFILR